MVSVNTSNLGSLQGMPDVEFDFGVSAELKRVFKTVPARIAREGAQVAVRVQGVDRLPHAPGGEPGRILPAGPVGGRGRRTQVA